LLKGEHTTTGKGQVGEIFPYLYWKEGATDSATNKETITSIHFQERYRDDFIALGNEYEDKNLWQCYTTLPETEKTPALQEALREFDQLMNIDWRLSHYRSAVRYLKQGEEMATATGGTNWQKYLPPKFQRTIFYPELWSDQEKEDWGKHWVTQMVVGK
jgi:tryptophan 2,3-dioxygenase